MGYQRHTQQLNPLHCSATQPRLNLLYYILLRQKTLPHTGLSTSDFSRAPATVRVSRIAATASCVLSSDVAIQTSSSESCSEGSMNRWPRKDCTASKRLQQWCSREGCRVEPALLPLPGKQTNPYVVSEGAEDAGQGKGCVVGWQVHCPHSPLKPSVLSYCS